MEGARTIITGGAGFIGTHLALKLLEKNAVVTVLALPTDDCSHLPDGIRIVRADVNSKADLAGVFGEQQFIFHLAARCDLDGTSIEDYRTNFVGTANVLREIGSSPSIIRFVLYSTQLVAGIHNETRFINETEPLKARTMYGESKILAERVTAELCSAYGIPYTIVRPTSVYGPYGNAPYESFFRMIRDGRYVHFGAADNLVSMVYVKNLIDLTLLLSVLKEAENETYFGNDFHPYTMREFAETAAGFYKKRIRTIPVSVAVLAAYALGFLKLIGMDVPLYPVRLRNMRANYCYDVQKAVRLGYLPRYDLRTGVYETLEWYEGNRWTQKTT